MTKNYLSLLLVFMGLALLAQPGTQSTILPITSTISFQGYEETTAHFGQGQYQVFYDNIDGVFDKPFILVDGFDPKDSNTIPVIYNSLIYNGGANNFFDDMRNQGMDIVILNFPNYTRTDDNTLIHGGADYIERNGLVLVQLLETLKPQIPSNKDFIIMGVSMGGLVSRYALTYMEQHTMEHKTGLWFSFDSPHRGANIPISLQYAFNYTAEYTNNNDMRADRDLTLNSPAAKQMLLDHYTSHLQSGHAYNQNTAVQLPTPAATFRSNFVSTMNTLGFPTQTRKLAISNGSINNTMVGSPGALIVDTTVSPAANTNTQIKLYFTPAATITNYQVDYIRTTYSGFQIALYTTVAASPATSAGLDSAPGGTVAIANYLGDPSDPNNQQIINALQVENFSFIPTLSSLAIENPNWYSSVNASMVTNFDAFIGPSVNEPHVTLSTQNLNFILTEINNHYLSIEDDILENSFVLLQNPTKDFIHFRVSNETNAPIHIELYNTSGLLISQNDFYSQANVYQCPTQSGVYFMRATIDDHVFLKKVIVK